MSDDVQRSIRRTAVRMTLVVAAMFGFGYALVPLYDVFCDITGIGGRTGVLSDAEARNAVVDENRRITVQFTGNAVSDLPWDFGPNIKQMEVTPGKPYTVSFTARNRTSGDLIGQAVPSVAPYHAGRFFNKTECFCFSNQLLAAGEEKDMPVTFVVDAGLPEDVRIITLSYSFFNATDLARDS